MTTKQLRLIRGLWTIAIYNGPLKLDTGLRQIKTLNFVVEYGKDITQKVHA